MIEHTHPFAGGCKVFRFTLTQLENHQDSLGDSDFRADFLRRRNGA